MDELILYTHPMSRGRTARWMLEEVGLPYRTIWLDYGTTMKAPEYLAVNPLGKVPALRHGPAVITECAAICTYLADAFPEAGLAPPPGSAARGASYRWLFIAAGPVEAAVIDRVLGVTIAAEQQAMVGYGSYDAMIDMLDAHLAANDYAAGDRFSAADIVLGAQIGWGLEFGTLPQRASFAAYAERLLARPAAQRARAIDDAAMTPAG